MIKFAIISGILPLVCVNCINGDNYSDCASLEDAYKPSLTGRSLSVIKKRSPEDQYPWNTRPFKLFINEINTDTATNSESQFMELRIVRRAGRRGPLPKSPFNSIMLLITRASNPAVVFYLDMGDLQLTPDTQNFIVIGEKDAENVNVPITHQAILNSLPSTDEPRHFPHGDKSPHVVMLLNVHHNRRSVTQFKLTRIPGSNKYGEFRLTSDLLHSLKPFIMDVVIYGRKCTVSSCKIFDDLWPETFKPDSRTSYILRDWAASKKTDFSINRCSILDEPFQPSRFKYCPPSPGKTNLCEQGFAFYIENVIDLIAPMCSANDDPVPGCSADFQNIPESRYEMICDERVGGVLDQMKDVVISTKVPIYTHASTVENLSALRVVNAEIKSLGGTQITQGTLSGNQFDNGWINVAKPYLRNQAALLTTTTVQNWLRLHNPGKKGNPVSFYCDACLMYSDARNVDKSLRKPIATEDGFFHNDIRLNTETIFKHQTEELHLLALKYSTELQLAASKEERSKLKEQAIQLQDLATAPIHRMVRTVITEVLAEIPFNEHKRIVDLQLQNGIDLGTRYHSQYGAEKIIGVVSSTMHITLLKSLVEVNKPFSIIVDATTNTQNIPYFIIYFMGLEDGLPITYYYRMLELKQGESSKATFESFLKAVREDDLKVPGFMIYVKTKIKYLISDNAAVMIGEKQSFLTEMKRAFDRDIPHLGCFAHKLSLVLKAALRDPKNKDLDLILNFEKELGDLYVFYQSRGSKRFQNFTATAEEFDMKPYRFKQNIQLRWAAAEQRVVETVLKNHVITTADLSQISEDTDYTRPVREKAKQLHDSLTDMTNILLHHEFADLLNINKMLSITLQERAAPIIDHAMSILSTFQEYKSLQTEYGKSLSNFIKTCSCGSTCVAPLCTMEQLEDCGSVSPAVAPTTKPVSKGRTAPAMPSASKETTLQAVCDGISFGKKFMAIES